MTDDLGFIHRLTRERAPIWDARPNQVWHGHIEVAPTTVITYGTRNVGEMVSLLWQQENTAGTMQLEVLWNALQTGSIS